MFENGKVYKIEVIENCMLQNVEKGDCYTIVISGKSVPFLKPRGLKVLFRHTLEDINYWLYERCKIIKVETMEQWKQRTA